MLALALSTLCAFILGLLARSLALPPLVGFLAAGFLLNGLGVGPVPVLASLGEVGVWLLLFTVGLKLRWQSLVRPEVWVTASVHLLLTAALAALLARVSGLAWPAAWLLGAAFSFSSTVLAAVVLEPRRELRAFHGRIVIGVLVVQDVVAVAVLAAGADVTPSPYAALLVLVFLARPLLNRLVDFVGHGELLVLLAVLLAVNGGGYGFHALGLSGEVGALLLGALLSGHPRSTELADALWGMKEIFLLCFFLGIGMASPLGAGAIAGGAALLLALPFKAVLFFVLLLALGLRARSSFLAALSLTSFSEFGLIVMQLGVRRELLDPQWLSLAAVAVAGSFALATPLNRLAHGLFARWEPVLQRFERRRRHPDDEPLSVGAAEVLVVGMGRVGSGAYRYLREHHVQVVGLDSDMTKVEAHVQDGRRVVYADGEDPELWHRLQLGRVRAVMLALPDTEAKIIASRQLRRRGFAGLIAATYVYDEERQPILDAGCDLTYNYFSEAGTGFAAHIADSLQGVIPAGAARRPG
ncbi:MAG: cation:proton antiporter [Gammaproteobacteria bacterium]|nr:cation:proton antiporter [Gammaproteobacteria bacterium]